MKLTLQLQLLPTPDQKACLLATMERFNTAATFAAKVGFEADVFSQPSIHKRCYAEIRERFGLSAQMAVRAIGKAVEAFATLKAKDCNVCPSFRPRGAITYDQRILSFKGLDKVSLWVLGGRIIVPLIYGEYQGQRFDRMKGQIDLIYRGGKFFLYATVEVPENIPTKPKDFLGVDLGIVNIATDSDEESHSGEKVERTRRRHHENRQRFQKKRSKGTKKRLKKLAGREARFRKHENHRISKKLVQKAKDTDRGIALENLTGIRDRSTVRAKDRSRHTGWSFFQLRAFVEYKAKLAGVPVVLVDARGTSRTCNACGHCEKGNRKSQAQFLCVHCGHSANADLNASRNIRDRAVRNAASKLAIDDPSWKLGEISRKASGL
jgi:IS605 OrfB family transposase